MFAEDTTMRPEVALPIGERLGQPDIAQTIIGQVEALLGQSEVYRRAVDSLQQLTAEGGIDGQILLKAVSLEAIRLTLDTVTRQAIVAPATEQLAITSEQVVSTEKMTAADRSSESLADQEADAVMFAAIASAMEASAAPKPHKNPIALMLDRYREQRQAAKIEEVILTREEILVQLGERIRLEREARDMSIAQLHARTFIPMYHLQALEGGHTAQLPEDIYLRGFLRRIENAFTLPTGSLVEALPNDVDVTIVPSWYERSTKTKRKSFAGLDINPTQLYFTYAAIMAGGVCWLSQQTAPKSNLPVLNYEPRAQNPMPQTPKLFSQTKPQSSVKSKAQLISRNVTKDLTKNSATGKAKAAARSANSLNVGVAPPETLR